MEKHKSKPQHRFDQVHKIVKIPRGAKAIFSILAVLAMSALLASAQVLTFDQAKQRADNGDPFAQAVVALHYQLGWQTAKDVSAAAKYALASAQAGHPYGLFRLGALYVSGEGVEKNLDLGYKLQSQAGQGLIQLAQDRTHPDPYAMTAVGIANFQGKVTPQNRARAVEWYKAAAGYGFAPAVFNYIMCEIEGQGLPKHPATYAHFVKQVPYSGSGCTCSHCNSPTPGNLYPQLLADYPPAKHFIAENIGRLEKDLQSATNLHGAPPLEEEYWNGTQNQETAVFEPPSLSGKSSEWHRLLTAGGNVDVDVRANYTGLSKIAQSGADGNGGDYSINPERTYVSWLANQGLFSNLQFMVVETEQGLQIKPNSLLAKKNRMGLCEYPIALEFKITNRGAKPVRLDSLGFDVKRSTVKTGFLPGLLFDEGDLGTDDDNSVVVHNFGWSAWKQGSRAKLGLWDKSQNLAEYKELQLEADKSTRVRVNDLNFSPVLLETLFTHPDYANRVMSLEIEGSRAWFEPNFSRRSADFYTRIDGDALLPSGKNDYRCLFDARREMPPNESAILNVTFSFDKSVDAALLPLVNVDGETYLGAELKCDYECLNHYAAPNSTFAVDGNDNAPIGSVQTLITGESVNTSSDGREERTKTFPMLASASAVQSVLKPRIQSVANVAVDERNNQEVTLFESKSSKDSDNVFRISGCLRGTTIEGHASLLGEADGKTIFRVPWSFEDVPTDEETLSISVVLGSTDQWCAWFVRVGSRGRIYTIFPGRNATVFAPVAPGTVSQEGYDFKRWVTFDGEFEDKIDRIGCNATGNSLVIRTAKEKYLLPLGSRVVAMLQDTINAEGMGVVTVYGTDLTDCSRFCLSVPMKPSEGNVVWSEFVNAPVPKCAGDTSPVAGVVWPTADKLAVKNKDHWDIWLLHAGAVRRASAQEADSFETKLAESRKPVAKLLEKINKPRRPDASQNWDDRVKEAFAVDTDSALLLVGQEGTLRARTTPRRSGLAIEFYNKANPSLWPERRFVVNPFGVGKQFANSTEFFTEIALSPDNKRAAAVTKSGNAIYLVDLQAAGTLACGVKSPFNPDKFSMALGDGSYMSGDGSAAGLVISDGHNALNLSQLEAKHNRPDKVLAKLSAPKDLISEAKRLRDRFLRRSDFRSFEGAALIDIPVVTVKTEVPEKTGEKSLKLDFEASNSTGPLKELRVFNNGALVKTLTLKGKDGVPSRESDGEVEVDLASGENRLQLMAVSEEGFTSAFAEKRVECTAEPDSRRCFIAAVGVSEYNDPRFNLKFAAKDAEDMSKALAEKALHRGYQPEVMVVKNAEVDAALVTKLREFLSKAGTDDEVMLFFAGHGLLDKNLEYHFARHDTDFDATENIGITFQELESLVDGIKPLRRTVLFDTCHSGEVEEEDKPQLLAMVGGPSAPAADSGVQVRGVATRGMKVKELEPKLRHTDFVELESLFPDSRRAKGANILTSSSGSEFSMESDAWQNGLFTYAFLNALKDEKTDANGDKTVSFSEGAAAVQDKVKTLSGGQQCPITRGVNREAEVTLASFGPPVAPIATKEKKSGWWPF